MKSYRYSMWDGTQDLSAVDADDLMDAMADELMSHGDLNQALRNLMRRGMRGNMGSGFEGIRELLERLKQQSRERLERYNLASLIDELKQRLEDILQMERAALDPQSAAGQQGTAGEEGGAATGSQEHDGEPAGAMGQQNPAGLQSQRGQQGQRGAQGQQGQAGQQGQRGPSGAGDRQQRMQFLDGLPPDFASRVKTLNNYEFFDPQAQQAFDELMEMLKQQAMGNMFRDMAQRMVRRAIGRGGFAARRAASPKAATLLVQQKGAARLVFLDLPRHGLI